VYGDVEKGSHSETHLLKPSNPYSATKASADMLVLAWARTYDVPYIILRPTNNYGVGQYVEKLVPKTCKYIKLGRKIPLHNQGLPVRNWLHAADTANAVIKIIQSETINEIYNVAGGFEQTNIDTVTKILKAFGKDTSNLDDYLDLSISRPGQDVRYSLDDTKLKNLGWNPEKHFNSEIGNIVSYYKDRFIW
jgi:dTDP-glucose 4,6-dehydratase